MATKSRRSLSGLHNKPYVGRRTGKVIEINARLDKFGFERVSDYFPNTDSESESETDELCEHIKENINQSAIHMSGKNDIKKIHVSLEKQVSSPVTESEKMSDSSPDKQISVPKSPVVPEDKPVSPSKSQLLSTMQRVTHMPPASINCSDIMAPSCPEEDAIPGSTRKKLRFSLDNTCFLREEESLDIQHSLISPSQQNDPVEEEYIVTDHEKDARSNKTQGSMSKKASIKRKQISRESTENVEELLTQEVCKSDDTFLTLNKPNNTLREMWFKNANNDVTSNDNHEEPKASDYSVSENPKASPGEKTVRVKSQASPEIEVVSTTNAQSIKKTTQSLIPVRKKKGAKLTFQVRSRRKPSPKTKKSLEDHTPTKTRYRKTPGAKKEQQKTTGGHAGSRGAENESAHEQGNDEANSSVEDLLKDAANTKSITIEKSSESQQRPHTSEPRSKRVTRSSKRLNDSQDVLLEIEQTLGPSEKETTSKDQKKDGKASKVSVPTRMAERKKVTIANQNAQDANEFDIDTAEKSKIPISLRKTKTIQEKATRTAKQIQYSEDILDDCLDADLPIILEADLSLQLKDDTTKHTASSRSLRKTANTQSPHAPQSQKASSILESESIIKQHKETTQKKQKNSTVVKSDVNGSDENPPMSSRRNTRSRKANETAEEAILEEQDKKSAINKSTSKIATAAKRGRNIRSSTKNTSKVSPNVSRDSFENESESECEESNAVDPLLNSPPISSPLRSFSTRSRSNNAGNDSLNVTETRSRASRKRKSETSRTEVVGKKPTKESEKQGTATKTAKSNTKSRGGNKSKTNQSTVRKCIVQNSEKSSGFSSDDEATTSSLHGKHNDVSNDTVSISSPEADGAESTIKAPRNKNKRVLKIDSITRANDSTEISETGDGLRRSQRNRVPCLQYWKNDRIEYERRESGLVVKDIIVNPTPAPIRRKKRSVYRKYQSKRANRYGNLRDDESDSSDMEIPDGMTEEIDAMATVLDADTLEDVQMKVLHNNKNLDFRSPTSNRDENSDMDTPLLLHKYFSQKKFGAGEIILRPGAEKGTQHVRRNIMIFHILSGQILFSIHNQSFTVTKGTTFFVPQGNIYNLKNLNRKRDARLIFSQIKE